MYDVSSIKSGATANVSVKGVGVAATYSIAMEGFERNLV